ncbi:23S rRNA (adenine(2030)-N(6))-methyltransferase RlmJ [Treponema sp. Marseille-Q4130]|uniref:23S rRNA (adenine(2030)-N(6))-methyltransferase RlmJ n=1 Tax=Treponema sp. Marseille-Q4130 TaxID=2766702 RepID=UPI001651D9F6|nr:23S rRNA (adenine(2030)-N(6))-methyltransferase RlmJ [Treponema sp. Marseille-Q4130]MBC6720120.1 23S rRNA (adenine(2030)-N(6))-methyltransferase RlmJ [Treponema sp. Marseille-Q4130]
MLSYRHAFHAGNHADVFKHTLLIMLLERFNAKEAPYTVIDTHSGSARYDLNDERAQKTLDAQSGILKLLEAARYVEAQSPDREEPAPQPSAISRDDLQSARKLSESVLRELLLSECRSDFIDFQKYFHFAKACLDAGFYPGSPEIERAFMRAKDCLILSELHPDEIGALQRNMRLNAANAENSPAVHIHHRDGFEALRALTPPKTKRGIVFCDPSYEDASDWEKAANALIETHKRWASATLVLWYPLVAIKKIERDAMKQKIIAGIKSGKTERGILDALLCVNTKNSHRESALKDVKRSEPPRLYGSGMLVVNPPWKIDDELGAVLPRLAEALGSGSAGSYKINNY